MKISYLTMFDQKLFTLRISAININFDNYQFEARNNVYTLYKKGVFVAQVGSRDVDMFERAMKFAVERKAARAA